MANVTTGKLPFRFQTNFTLDDVEFTTTSQIESVISETSRSLTVEGYFRYRSSDGSDPHEGWHHVKVKTTISGPNSALDFTISYQITDFDTGENILKITGSKVNADQASRLSRAQTDQDLYKILLAREDTIKGSAFTDNLVGMGGDTIYGLGGDDFIRSTSTDRVFGGDGDDYIRSSTIYGVKSTQVGFVDGGAGDDLLITSVDVDGGAGDDRIESSAAKVDGGAGDDVLIARNGDEVNGGDGDDRIETSSRNADGGAGDDVLIVNGVKNVIGGEGTDAFVVHFRDSAAPATTRIADFDPAAETVEISSARVFEAEEIWRTGVGDVTGTGGDFSIVADIKNELVGLALDLVEPAMAALSARTGGTYDADSMTGYLDVLESEARFVGFRIADEATALVQLAAIEAGLVALRAEAAGQGVGPDNTVFQALLSNAAGRVSTPHGDFVIQAVTDVSEIGMPFHNVHFVFDDGAHYAITDRHESVFPEIDTKYGHPLPKFAANQDFLLAGPSALPHVVKQVGEDVHIVLQGGATTILENVSTEELAVGENLILGEAVAYDFPWTDGQIGWHKHYQIEYTEPLDVDAAAWSFATGDGVVALQDDSIDAGQAFLQEIFTQRPAIGTKDDGGALLTGGLDADPWLFLGSNEAEHFYGSYGWTEPYDAVLFAFAGDDRVTLTPRSYAAGVFIDAGDGDDTVLAAGHVLGGAGDDILQYAAHNDLSFTRQIAYFADGGDGDDRIVAGGRGFEVRGGSGDDQLAGPSVYLAGADARYFGDDGDDLIQGGAEADRIDGGTGADRMEGLAGNDVYFVDDVGDRVVEAAGGGFDVVYTSIQISRPQNVEELRLLEGGVADLTGGGGDDVLGGNDAANTLKGGGGDDTLLGGGGSDTLLGHAGRDEMRGGAGDDVYFVDDAGDRVIEAAGEGWDTIYAPFAMALPDNVEEFRLQGLEALGLSGRTVDDSLWANDAANILKGFGGDDALYGQGGDDTVIGHEGRDRLFGDDGDDTLSGGDDDDRAWGGLGADKVWAGSGADVVFGGEGDDVIKGGDGDDNIFADGGADTVSGEAGDDLIRGHAGDDTLLGGEGDDRLLGWADADLLDGGLGADRMWGGDGGDTYLVDDLGDWIKEYGRDGGVDTAIVSVDGYRAAYHLELVQLDLAAGGTLKGSFFNDHLAGDVGADTLLGYTGHDRLTGGDGDDTLLGHEGYDVLEGGAGDDVLRGGLGRDSYTGGAGADRFLMEVGGGLDRVYDFELGLDLLDLRVFGLESFEAFQALATTRTSGYTQIDLGGDDVVLLYGVVAEDMTGRDVLI